MFYFSIESNIHTTRERAGTTWDKCIYQSISIRKDFLPIARPILKSASESLNDSGRNDPVKTIVFLQSGLSLILADIQIKEKGKNNTKAMTCKVGGGLSDGVCPMGYDDPVRLTGLNDVPDVSPAPLAVTTYRSVLWWCHLSSSVMSWLSTAQASTTLGSRN